MDKVGDAVRLAHGEITHEIIGAFYDVYNGLGHGFVESVYAKALRIALKMRGVHFELEVPLTVHYLDQLVGEFRADLVVEGCVIVELKAADKVVGAHESQMLNYLRAAKLQVGLILNFGPRASTRRLIWTGERIKRG
jgi:GxxExxY protein